MLVVTLYDRVINWVAGRIPEGFALLFMRVVLAGIFWRSGQTKIAEGTWFTISENTFYLFQDEYSGVPLPSDLAAVMATVSEHLFPILLVLGLFTRLSAFALLGMTMVIQIFVYPDAWWQVHSLWFAMALILIVRGGGWLSLDSVLVRRLRGDRAAA
ncbi:DoxX family protein [Sphingopyxis alaskensis]|jgi:putative oxidoreductase|uniref:DoxX n=1 Tax=Sphingopyxis alaskensis (strain DSM 13593 / LMG 18877 / RB2256) TaxID=317655 RepID=Q1GPN8_SPHAL|nr:DoxX family protein [Sphingopyxis alaskensis]ABF54384.1 DoxX [Sphingopyxis alaskensis RB2256]MCM3417902.1 DoxX family protein [Sphingopyxis alaskensis]